MLKLSIIVKFEERPTEAGNNDNHDPGKQFTLFLQYPWRI